MLHSMENVQRLHSQLLDFGSDELKLLEQNEDFELEDKLSEQNEFKEYMTITHELRVYIPPIVGQVLMVEYSSAPKEEVIKLVDRALSFGDIDEYGQKILKDYHELLLKGDGDISDIACDPEKALPEKPYIKKYASRHWIETFLLNYQNYSQAEKDNFLSQAFNQDAKYIRAILKAGANPNGIVARSARGPIYALEYALIYASSLVAVKLLLKKGANPSKRMSLNNEPFLNTLMHKYPNECKSLVILALKKKADAYLSDNDGLNAFDIAKQFNWESEFTSLVQKIQYKQTETH